MSLVGLEESEKQAEKLTKAIQKDLKALTLEAKEEIVKLKYLLEKEQLNVPADKALLDRIRSRLTEADKSYRRLKNLPVNAQPAAWIRQYERQLRQQLSQKQALSLEAELKVQQLKINSMANILQKENEIAKEAALRQAYDDARRAGGILSNQFNRLAAQDIVRLNTKKTGAKTLGAYMEKLYNQYGAAYKQAYIRAMSSNFTVDTIIADLQKNTNITAGKAKLLVKTESNAIFNDQIEEAIRNNPLVKGYRFRATLDSRTSDICAEHDGKYYSKEELQPGVNFPPLHPNCRSSVTTVFVNQDERKDLTQRKARTDSNEWVTVPPGMTYQEYKATFGFSDSRKPKVYKPNNVYDNTLEQITTQYRGYVTPSVASQKKVQGILDAIDNNDLEFLNQIKKNTGKQDTGKAIFRQAQAEAGYDGLPLTLDPLSFNSQVEQYNSKVYYRYAANPEQLQQSMYGTDAGDEGGQYLYGAGIYAYEGKPSKSGVYGDSEVAFTIRSESSRILDLTEGADSILGSQTIIGSAITPDEKINAILSKYPTKYRRNVISVAAVMHGYDAIRVQSQGEGIYLVLLNRTAAIVKGK